jgi:hypothetical protein
LAGKFNYLQVIWAKYCTSKTLYRRPPGGFIFHLFYIGPEAGVTLPCAAYQPLCSQYNKKKIKLQRTVPSHSCQIVYYSRISGPDAGFKPNLQQ